MNSLLSKSNPPTMAAEPEFTAGGSNMVTWSDESASGAVAYYAECATDANEQVRKKQGFHRLTGLEMPANASTGAVTRFTFEGGWP